ncbi:MAG: LuxR C-terminal-related transcriptional regulator [Thermoleophilia bacterium]|nr:LuxR C-terminal-related transcriptional regulator [Thermoleophilia bacterium]
MDTAGRGPHVPLLRSKLTPPPPRSGIASRGRLLDRLREGRGRRLTLVCAPAGYGKTTVLAQWREADAGRTPFAWVSADDGDRDPVRFWSHLIAALKAVHPRAGAASADALGSGAASLAGVVLPLLMDELSDAPPAVLVVDDWHLVRSPGGDEAMRVLVEHAPEPVQIVLSSRAEPDLPLGRLRAHGELRELGAADLRLSHVEAASFLRAASVDLGPRDVARLTERTEGWAAGLSLASILLRREEDPGAFVRDFAGDSRHLLEYLAGDVLAGIGPEMRGFLLRASVLREVSGPACDAVLATQGSAAMLAEAERANLFLVPVDRHGEAYRFHGLFADALRRELLREHPGEVPGLHARASAWFDAQGDADAAIEHAIAGRDAERASDLVARHWRGLVHDGRLASLGRWLGELSWPEAAADPQLALVRASVAAQDAQPADRIEHWLGVADVARPPARLALGVASIESGIAILRSLYLTRGPGSAEAAATRALRLEAPESAWRRQALLGLGQARVLQGRAGEARAPLEAARRLPDPQDHAPAAAAVLAYLALVELEAGDPAAARRHADESLDLLDARGLGRSYVAMNTHIALAAVCAAEADAHGEAEHLELAAELSAPARPSHWHLHALVRLVSARRRLGDLAGAAEAVESARAELERLPDPGALGALLEVAAAELARPPRHEGFYGEPLSDAERRVLRLLVAGRSVAQVARDLHLAPTTVKTHRRTIYRKLGVASRQEATRRAAELSITSTGDRLGAVPPPLDQR